MNQQVRTVRLSPDAAGPDDELWAKGDVLIIGPGTSARARAGQTIAQTLRSAGVPLPSDEQTVRVNREEIRDLNHVLRQGDRITITQRVRGG